MCQLKHKNRSAMRKQWTEEQMSAALNSVKTEGLQVTGLQICMESIKWKSGAWHEAWTQTLLEHK